MSFYIAHRLSCSRRSFGVGRSLYFEFSSVKFNIPQTSPCDGDNHRLPTEHLPLSTGSHSPRNLEAQIFVEFLL